MSTPVDRRGPQVPRFGHGSRVPGWDEAVDLEKDPSGVPDPATTYVPDDLRAEIEAAMAKYPDRRSASIPALAAAQQRHGWLSPEAVEQVASVMRLTTGYLISVATFYDMLETTPIGLRSIYVCTNISCSLRGGDELFGALAEATQGDDDVNVRHFECLGACDIAPMLSVDGVYLGPVGLDEVDELLGQIKAGEAPLPDKQLIRRRCQDPGANTQEFPIPDPVGLPARRQDVMPPPHPEFGPRMDEEPSASGEAAPIEQPPSFDA